MDKEQLKRMGGNPKFISGIYNYCDRWCERCPYTSKCMVYAMEQAEDNDAEAKDIRNEKFWMEVGESFQLAMELLHDLAEQEGVDLEDIDHEAIEAQEREIRQKAREHPASRQAHAYGKKVNKWFTEASEDFENIEDALLQKLRLGLPEEKLQQEGDHLRNLIEIIRWYQHQIYVKIMRALQGRYNESEEDDPIQNDANGSTKVAIIGIERSMSAFAGLLELIPDQEDEILDILVLLQQIKWHLESSFPNAHAFQRPGFDAL